MNSTTWAFIVTVQKTLIVNLFFLEIVYVFFFLNYLPWQMGDLNNSFSNDNSQRGKISKPELNPDSKKNIKIYAKIYRKVTY